MNHTLVPTIRSRQPGVVAEPGWAGTAATVLGTVALGLTLAAVTLELSVGDAGELVRGFRLYGLIAVPAFGIPGMVVAARHPRNAVGWVMLAVAFSHTVALAAASYGYAGFEEPARDLPGASWAVWVSTWAWVPGHWLVPTLLLLLFPDGRPPSRRWRPLVGLGIVGLVWATAAWAVLPYDQHDVPPDVDIANPVGLDLASELMGADLVLGIVLAAASLASLVVRFRRSAGVERQQVKWVAVAGGLVLALLTVAFSQPLPIGPYVLAAAMVPLPAAIGVAVVRHRLWDVDLVINRSLVYGALTLVILVVYVVTVATVGGLLGATTGAPLVATGLVALGIQPVRERLQRLANRLLYGERDDPYQAISRLARRLDTVGSGGETVAGVAEAVARALRLPYVAVVAGGEVVAAHGRPVADPMRLPLTCQGQVVGELLVVGRGPGVELVHGQQRLLADLARQVGVAIHAQQLTADLQRSRERLVSAREEERRRLRRDLHDDLGPSLAAAALQLDRARDLAGVPAGELLEDVARRLRGVVGEVRVLVEGLRPRALDDLGLVSALRQQAARLSGGDLDIVLDVPEDLGPLPAAVEVAAYRIVSEALNNVARHAAARAACVVLRRDDGLGISVTDDGRGMPEVVRSGVGLTSMRERAEELGGTLAVRPRPGAGTAIEAWLPVPTS